MRLQPLHAVQVLADPRDGGVSLVGWAPVQVGPAQLSAAASFVAGFHAPVIAGNVTFAVQPRDAGGRPILSDPQVGGCQALCAGVQLQVIALLPVIM